MKISTLRSKGFSVVKLAGPVTHITHKHFFTINGKSAKKRADHFYLGVRGWYEKELPYDIELVENEDLLYDPHFEH